MRGWLWVVAISALGACGPTASDGPTSEASSGESTAGSSEGSGVMETGPADTTTDGTTSLDGSTSLDGGSTTSASTGEPVCMPLCEHVFECADGIDNDGDGWIDTEDPECVSPCHDGEDTTSHGLPIGGGGCTRDCYFDDDVGPGDDGCFWDLTCDPLSPGDSLGCPADVDQGCDNLPVDPECPDRCLPLTPPGCDCYGCCTFPTPRGPEDRWIEHPDCSLSNIEACDPCTKSTTCDNPCDDPCEWCFGQPQLPPGCAEATCDHGSPCTEHCDCPEGVACMQGCCRPGSIF